MTMTRSQRLREADEHTRQGLIAPDRSVIVARFDDGWTIRRMSCAGDVRREGWLMRNCCAKYVGDVFADEDKSCRTVTRCAGIADTTPHVGCDEAFVKATAVSWTCLGLTLHSLRDVDNLPRATFWAHEGYAVQGIGGYRNDKTVKASHLDRIRTWARATGTPILEEDQRAAQAVGFLTHPACADDYFSALMMIASFPPHRQEVARACVDALITGMCQMRLLGYALAHKIQQDQLDDVERRMSEIEIARSRVGAAQFAAAIEQVLYCELHGLQYDPSKLYELADQLEAS